MRKSPEELLQHSPQWAKDYVLSKKKSLPPRFSSVVETFLSWKKSSIQKKDATIRITAFNNICDQKDLPQTDKKRAWDIIQEKI